MAGYRINEIDADIVESGIPGIMKTLSGPVRVMNAVKKPGWLDQRLYPDAQPIDAHLMKIHKMLTRQVVWIGFEGYLSGCIK